MVDFVFHMFCFTMKFQVVILSQKNCTIVSHQNKTGTIHHENILISDTFMKIMKGAILAIEDQVRLKPDQLTFNQFILKLIIETIIFCGCQTRSLTR